MYKFFLYFLSTAFLVNACGSKAGLNYNTIKRINVFYKSPVGITGNKVETFEVNFFITYYHDYVLYELPYHVTKEIDNHLIYDSIKYEYFIQNKKNNYGFLLKDLNNPFSNKIDVDSILQRALGGGVNGDCLSELKIKDTKIIDKGSEKVTYKYIIENQFYDSAYFYYDAEMTDIDFTLCQLRDTIQGVKLYKTQYFLKKGEIFPGIPIDFYENVIQIKRAPLKNTAEFIMFFDKCKREEKSLH